MRSLRRWKETLSFARTMLPFPRTVSPPLPSPEYISKWSMLDVLPSSFPTLAIAWPFVTACPFFTRAEPGRVSP